MPTLYLLQATVPLVIESGIEASSDDRLEELKKQRLLMLDEVSAMIGSASYSSLGGVILLLRTA